MDEDRESLARVETVLGAAIGDNVALIEQVNTVTANSTSAAARALFQLQSDLASLTGGATATAQAVKALDTRVTDTEGLLSAQAGDITDLQSALTTAEGDITGNATALGALTTRVTQTETGVGAVAADLTSLTTTVGGLSAAVSTHGRSLDGICAE